MTYKSWLQKIVFKKMGKERNKSHKFTVPQLEYEYRKYFTSDPYTKYSNSK